MKKFVEFGMVSDDVTSRKDRKMYSFIIGFSSWEFEPTEEYTSKKDAHRGFVRSMKALGLNPDDFEVVGYKRKK